MKRRGRVWAADRAKAAQRAPFRAQRSQKREFDVDDAHGAAITEPHPRLSDCQPDVFSPGPFPGPL
jgi:hypothetical protein